ncbi:MAG: DUF6273 domain-containing protein [Aristaeellaceae bacterium]
MNIRHLQPGNQVSFGRYPQGAMGEVQPIAWQVLDVREDRALLLSRYVLDMQPFHSEQRGVRWMDSAVRQWLQETFLPTAFSREEQAEICRTASEADPFDDFPTRMLSDGEEQTDDPVFLLSTEEVRQYFHNENELFCTDATAQMTPWVAASHPDVDEMDDNVCWWLRSRSGQRPFAFIVSPVDSIGVSMISPDNCQGVRPALWVRIG